MVLPRVFKAEKLYTHAHALYVLFPSHDSSVTRSILGVVLVLLTARIALTTSVITRSSMLLFISLTTLLNIFTFFQTLVTLRLTNYSQETAYIKIKQAKKLHHYHPLTNTDPSNHPQTFRPLLISIKIICVCICLRQIPGHSIVKQ